MSESDVVLYQFPRAFGIANPSPFCMKVECVLRMASIPYTVETITDPRRMPRGKAPVIRHAGRMIPDSAFIVEHLRSSFRPDIDSGLSSERRAVAHAFERMLEERTYWVLVYSRWIDAINWPRLEPLFFGTLPPGVRQLVSGLIRRRIRTTLHGQGIGRHDEEDIYALGVKDLRAVAAWLGDRPYVLGDAPRLVDATVYAFVANALHGFESPLSQAARAEANLVAYSERMTARYFPDLQAAPADC